MKQGKKWLALVCAVSVLVCQVGTIALAEEADGTDVSGVTSVTDEEGALNAVVQQTASSSDDVSYSAYLEQHADAPRPETEIVIQAADYVRDDGAGVTVGSYAGRDNVLLWDSQEGGVEWEVQVEQEGLYNLAFSYCGIEYKGNDIELMMYVDGEIPYTNAQLIALPRLWQNETNEFEYDLRGNEIRPDQVELFEWQDYGVIDNNAQYNGHLSFYLSKGTHTIRLEVLLEALALDSIRFYQAPEPSPYADVLAVWEAEGAQDTSGYSGKYEAEKPILKSSSVLFPTYDKGSVSMSPSDPSLTRYNTIGKDTWDTVGQRVTWEIEVPEDGYYYLAFKARQNVKRGMFSTRAIYIDGEIPYTELGNVQFKFQTDWYMQTVSDAEGTPYKIYLTAGKHTLAMEALVGDVAELLRNVQQLVTELNTWYRQIVMITGSNADSTRVTIDLNRNFNLDKKIPGLMEAFQDIRDRLEDCMDETEAVYGGGSNAATVVAQLIEQLDHFIDDPDTIAKRLESYRTNVSSLASWVLDMRDQPLELDYFVLYSPDQPEPKDSGNFWDQIVFRFQSFLNSFSSDYDSLGNTYDSDVIEVWVSTSDLATTGISSGRDQAQVIKKMIDDSFVPQTGINVNLSLVNSSTTLVQAVLANKGPDAALVVSKDTPVNLAMRNALVALDDFDDFDEVCERFMDCAIIPYQYLGKTYALPETQSYDMLFYRKDIFEELNLEVPETWQEFYALIPVLQQHSLLIGIPENQKTFESLLYQNGGQFYNDDLTATAFDTPEALTAFEKWTGLYAKYSLPLVFDFFNRFRSGEMPLAIMPYTQCNYLSAAAPELRNLWDFAPIPGTLQEDGSIDRSETAQGTACIILKNSEKQNEAYEFLKWWTSAEAQARFGTELEQLMGAAARYPTANVEAFEQLPWSKSQSENLMKQWEEVIEIPQIPGNYYINRNVSFAFRAVVYNAKNERETLYKYNKEINKEITRKRNEFKLSTAAEGDAAK